MVIHSEILSPEKTSAITSVNTVNHSLYCCDIFAKGFRLMDTDFLAHSVIISVPLLSPDAGGNFGYCPSLIARTTLVVFQTNGHSRATTVSCRAGVGAGDI